MRLAVSPTRMEILRLRKRFLLAKRGHKLLKNKQEELLHQFLKLIAENKGFRESLEESLTATATKFLLIQARVPEEILEGILIKPEVNLEVESSEGKVLNISVPHFALLQKGDFRSFNSSAPTSLNRVLNEYLEILKELLRLAELERKIELFAAEIERTRRRVNALEYILIPNLEETITYIEFKLEELERGNLVRLKRVKEVLAMRVNEQKFCHSRNQ